MKTVICLSLLILTACASSPKIPRAPAHELSQKLKKLSPGETFTIPDGLYTETALVIEAIGTKDKPITITGNMDQVILQGMGVQNGLVNEPAEKNKIQAIVVIQNSKHIIFENITLKDSAGEGLRVWNSENITIRNCSIQKTWGRGLGGNGKNLLFENNEIFDTVLQNEDEQVLVDREKGIERSWSAAASTWYLPNNKPSKNVRWINNKINNSWGEGLSALHVDGGELTNNEITNGYATLIYVDHSRNIKVSKNKVANTSSKYITKRNADYSPGIMMAAENYPAIKPYALNNILIEENEISSVSVGIGFWRDPANKSPLNRYEHVSIIGNTMRDISLLGVSFPSVDASNKEYIRGILKNNVISRPKNLWRDNKTPTYIRLDDSEQWAVENNQFLDN